jgi:hypothetical protein
MGGRMRDKRRPPSPNAIRRTAAHRPVLPELNHLPLEQLHDFGVATMSEIERLQGNVKQSQAAIVDLQQVLQLVKRLLVQRSPDVEAFDGVRLPYAEVAASVLRAVGHPMQLGELIVEMAARGAVVAGKTERQRRSNLIITLGRSPLVRRVGHGVYALSETRAGA